MKKAFFLLLLLSFSLQAQKVELDSSSQEPGNAGNEYRPVDDAGQPAPFTIKSRTKLKTPDLFKPDASGKFGTLYFGTQGLGVQNDKGKGSFGISKKEELIFSFDSPVFLNAMKIGVVDLHFEKNRNIKADDPVFFVDLVGNQPQTLTLDAEFLENLYTAEEGNAGFFNFEGAIEAMGLPEDAALSSLRVRETADDFLVSYVETGQGNVEVPEPGTYLILAALLMAAAALHGLRKRRIS